MEETEFFCFEVSIFLVRCVFSTEIPVIVENNIDLNSQLTSNLVEGVGSMCGIRSGKLLVVFNAL